MSLMLLGTAARAAAQTPSPPAPPPAPPPGPPAAPAAAAFDLQELRVEGNTRLPSTEVEAAVYDFLGPGKSAADVEHARAALEALYARRGFATVSVEIPRQRVAGGLVVLRVVERPVGRVRVVGSRYFDPSAVRAGAPSLAPGTVPDLNRVQRDIVALNQLPDRSVTPSLRAGRAPDTVDVDLQVTDKLPLHGSLELNNRQSQGTTALRVAGSLSYGNLWQRGDSASFAFQVAPQHPSDAKVFSGTYLFHIPDSNLSLLGSYLNSDSNVNSVGSTNVIGKGTIAGLRLLVPLGLGEGFIHTLAAGFDYKHLDEDLSLTGAFSRVPITYVPFTVSYQASWSGERTTTDLLSSLIFAVRGIGSDAVEFEAKRYGATPNFAYLRGDLSHTATLPHDLQLYARAQAQAAPEPLVSSEQISIGGLDSVRGYLESEALGDYGAVLQAELRSPSLSERLGDPVNALRFHLFLDAGGAAIHKPLPQQVSSYGLASIGIGARLRLWDHFNAAIENAFTLSPGPVTKGGTDRVLFRIYGDF